MAHVTGTEVGYAIGATEWAQMTDSDSSIQSQLLNQATSIMNDSLTKRGYAAPSSNAGNDIKAGTIGILIPMLWGRKGLQYPEGLQIYVDIFKNIADVKNGMPLEGLEPSPDAGIGGVEFTESSTSVSDSKPKVFGGLRTIF